VPAGVGLTVVGLFLVGGAWSIFRADHVERGRTRGQLVFSGVLLLAGLLLVASGILRQV
jgi:ABC-type Na+ efflux pump permease subunit